MASASAGALFFKYFMCLLLTSCILGAPLNLCPQKTDNVNTVGLCNTSTGFVDIWDCTSCPPGLGLSVKCGNVYPLGTKIECVRCERGRTYSDKNDIRQCEPCRQCQENEIVNGTCETDGDTTSCSCKPGYYRDILTRDCMPCSWCCGDKTNEYKPECNIPQVPPGKQCSLQTVKSCSPTTPPPPPLPPPTTTPIPFITSTTSPTPAPTTIHSKATEPLKNSTFINGDTDSNDSENTPKDPQKRGEEPGGGAKNPKMHLALVVLFSVMTVVVLVIIVIAGIRSYWNRNDQPPLQRNQRYNIGDGPRNEEHVDLDPDGAVAFYHVEPPPVPQGPNGVEPTQANGTRLNEQQLHFIIEKLGTKIVDLKHDVMQTLCSMLNVQINRKDYRNLDSFCNLTYHQKRGLENSDNPMDTIIEVMVRDLTTLESFMNELYRISRGDVVQQLYEIATRE